LSAALARFPLDVQPQDSFVAHPGTRVTRSMSCSVGRQGNVGFAQLLFLVGHRWSVSKRMNNVKYRYFDCGIRFGTLRSAENQLPLRARSGVPKTTIFV